MIKAQTMLNKWYLILLRTQTDSIQAMSWERTVSRHPLSNRKTTSNVSDSQSINNKSFQEINSTHSTEIFYVCWCFFFSHKKKKKTLLTLLGSRSKTLVRGFCLKISNPSICVESIFDQTLVLTRLDIIRLQVYGACS